MVVASGLDSESAVSVGDNGNHPRAQAAWLTGGIIRERPETAAFLRTLGAKFVGKATLDTYLKQAQGTTK